VDRVVASRLVAEAHRHAALLTLVRIREANETDLDRVGEIRTVAWQAAYRGILADDVLDGLDARAEAERWRGFWKEFPANGSTLLVAEDGGEVLGYALVRSRARDESLADDVGELIAIYLHPEAWGAGAGQALFEAAGERLRTEGCRGAVLWTFAANNRARRFYERNGWQPDGAADVYAGQPGVRYRIDW
jgi:GNAT superfamily N-acetyltransferase